MKGYPPKRKAQSPSGSVKQKRSHSRHSALYWTGLLGLVFAVSGCAMIGPDYVKPTVPEPTEWMASQSPEIKAQDADLSRWWTVFNDPVLDALVDAAYRQNLNLQIAGLRIMEARAQLGIAVGFQFPQNQQALGSASVNQFSDNAPNGAVADKYFAAYDIGFDALWELDVWGKFRRGVQTGVANLQATVASYDDILVSLTAEVARTYLLLRTSEERMAVAHAHVACSCARPSPVRTKAG